jgi:hypothetical protein
MGEDSNNGKGNQFESSMAGEGTKSEGEGSTNMAEGIYKM